MIIACLVMALAARSHALSGWIINSNSSHACFDAAGDWSATPAEGCVPGLPFATKCTCAEQPAIPSPTADTPADLANIVIPPVSVSATAKHSFCHACADTVGALGHSWALLERQGGWCHRLWCRHPSRVGSEPAAEGLRAMCLCYLLKCPKSQDADQAL